jgi:hypothetical protein
MPTRRTWSEVADGQPGIQIPVHTPGAWISRPTRISTTCWNHATGALFFLSSFDYFINEKYLLSGTYFKTVWSEQTDEVDKAFSLAFTRYFGGK